MVAANRVSRVTGRSKQSVTATISRLFVSAHISSSAPVGDPSGESVSNKA